MLRDWSPTWSASPPTTSSFESWLCIDATHESKYADAAAPSSPPAAEHPTHGWAADNLAEIGMLARATSTQPFRSLTKLPGRQCSRPLRRRTPPRLGHRSPRRIRLGKRPDTYRS